jgi:hypothetical protein
MHKLFGVATYLTIRLPEPDQECARDERQAQPDIKPVPKPKCDLSNQSENFSD